MSYGILQYKRGEKNPLIKMTKRSLNCLEKILKQVEDESARRMEHSFPGFRIDQLNSFLYKNKE